MPTLRWIVQPNTLFNDQHRRACGCVPDITDTAEGFLDCRTKNEQKGRHCGRYTRVLPKTTSLARYELRRQTCGIGFASFLAFFFWKWS